MDIVRKAEQGTEAHEQGKSMEVKHHLATTCLWYLFQGEKDMSLLEINANWREHVLSCAHVVANELS